MNRNRYRTIFSKRLGMLVPVAETTKTQGRSSGAAADGASAATELVARPMAMMRPVALAVTAALWGQMAFASPPLPTGGDIATGSGSIVQSGNTLTVNQSSQNLAANWQSFDIGADHAVVFNQPNSSAVALNRVIGSDASSIYGSLSANGHVFLVNPNGVLFAPGSQVSVGGLVASTLTISDADFAAGRYRFADGSGAGSVVNEGSIEAGSVALLGPKVVNRGTIRTPGGNTTLAAGDRVTVSMLGGLLTAEVDAAVANAEIQNHGQILADGGRVGLLAGRADSVLDSLINTDGLIQANSIRNENGKIYLDGGAGGTVTVSGTVDASAGDGGDGGEVRVIGDRVTLGAGATVDVSGQRAGGSALIGGDFQGKNPEIHNARLTTVERGAAIRADGTEQGGNVIVWADNTTQFDGEISALGRGFAEVSGKGVLRFSGEVDTGGGTLLLDPTDITIQNTDGDLDNTYSGSQIATLLGANDVILDADNNITWNVDAALDYNGIGIRTLTLQAGNNISFHGSISDSVAGGDMLSVVFNADRDASGAGVIAMGNGASIHTSGGDIILRGGNAVFAALPSFTDGGYEAALRATAARGIALAGSTLDAGGGDIAMRGAGVDGISLGVGVGSNGTVRTTGSGTITVDGIGGAGTDTNRGIYLQGGADWSTVDGTLTLQGTGGGTVGIENTGVRVNSGSTVEATGSGNVTINGLGAAGGSFNDGIVVEASTLRVADGILTVTGTGRGSGFGSDGIELAFNAVFEATGLGSMNLNGTSTATGGNTNRGVTVWLSSALRTASGALTVQGTGAGGPTSGDGISLEANGMIGGVDQTGAITLTADTMNLADLAVQGSGSLLLQPLTPTTTIGLGDAAIGTLNLTSAEIGRLADGFSSITIGRSDGSGAIDVRNAVFLDPVTIRTPAGSGSITVNGSLSTGGGTSAGSITLQAADDISLAAASSIVTQGQTIALNADHINGSSGAAIDTGSGTVELDAVSGGVDFGGVAIESDSLLVTGTGTFDLSSVSNAVSTFASSTSGGALTFVNSQGVAIGTVGATQGIGISGGNLTVQTTSGDIVLNERVTAAGTAEVTLASAADFTNNAGASAIAIGTGHFQVWSTDPANDVRGGIDYDYKQYNADYASTTVLGSGNGFLYALAPSITVSLTGTVSKAYDGTTTATVAAGNYSASGVVDGDVVTLNNPVSGSYTSAGTGGTVARDAATDKTVSVSGIAIASSASSAGTGSKAVYGYSLANTTADGAVGVITPKAVTLIPGDVIRTYDGGTAYTTTAGDLAALTAQLGIAGDTVSTAAISYADKNAGTANKSVTLDSVTVSDGNGGGNYNVTLAGNSTSTINKAIITAVTGIAADNKIYDSTTAATLDTNAAGFAGMVGGDSLSVATASGAFADKNAGTAKTVNISGIDLGGADAGNYDLADTTATATADIAKATITAVTGITANDKIYDGTTAATLDMDGADFTGMFGGDTLSVATASGAFADKNAGTAMTANISGIGLGGADAGNYNLANTTATTTADITPATLTVNGVTANDKVYDGTTAATLTTAGHALSGVLTGDTVALNESSYSALFGDKNAGMGKTVTATGLRLSGADANNYTLAQPTGLTADIAQRPLTVTAVTNSKTYDGTTSAASTPIVTGELATGDSFVTLAEEYATANVGTGLTLIPILVIEDGNGGANYALTLVNNTTGEIIRPAIDLSQVGGSYTAAKLDNSGKDGRRDQDADGANGDHGAGSAGGGRRKLDDEFERRVVQVIATGLRLPQGITASALDDFGSFEADSLQP